MLGATVAVAGPLALSHGDVQAAASLDGFIFVPLAIAGGAWGVLHVMRRSSPPR